MQKHTKGLKIYFITSLPLLAVGVYGLLSQHVHISGHAPDSLHCVSDFGFQQLPFAIVLTIASFCGFFVLKTVVLKLLFIISTVCMVIVLLLGAGLGFSILSGGCGGNLISVPSMPSRF